MQSRLLREVATSGVEFLFLLLLWMMFVDKWSAQEFGIGVAAAILGAIGDAIVKSEGFAPFRPRMRWVVLIFWEPWYVMKGTWIAFRELARSLAGQEPDGRFQSVPFRYDSDGEAEAARRALFAAYVTVSPDTIVVGLDHDSNRALLHQLGPKEVSELAHRLGVPE